MDTIADVLHHLIDNVGGFVDREALAAHKLITDHFGGDRHYTVPDPENPDAGRNDPDVAQDDPRDAEIARLRAELAARDPEAPAEPADPSADGSEPDAGNSGVSAQAPASQPPVTR